MTITTINDSRIKIRPSEKLAKLIEQNYAKLKDIPENVANVLKSEGYNIPSELKILTSSSEIAHPKINTELIKKLAGKIKNNTIKGNEKEKLCSNTQTKYCQETDRSQPRPLNGFLYLNDLYWFHNFLIKLRREENTNIFLIDVLNSCELILPENEIIPRNPELEARCQKLRTEQENREYQKITKNVDAARQKYPEDTISYQIKAINKQLVAVLQFVVSVVTGFVFGFWGLPLIFGTLKFGLRLILGIIFALIIALAEMYFLAVKLNEYDNAVDTSNGKPKKPGNKIHAD